MENVSQPIHPHLQTTETASSFTEAPESSTESPSADFSLTTQSSLDTTTATATSWSFAQLLLTANTAASACYIGLMDDSSCNNEGGVYLVPTSWIQNHPGGADAIKSRCGHVSYHGIPSADLAILSEPTSLIIRTFK